MLKILQKGYRYIEKRRAALPRIFFHGGAAVTILLLLYTLFDLRATLGQGVFADLEEKIVPLLEHALVCGIIPMGTAALMRNMAGNSQ